MKNRSMQYTPEDSSKSIMGLKFILLVILALLATFLSSLAISETVYHDRFQWQPDVDGPSIQIIPPQDWLTGDLLTVIIEDPSGVATRQGHVLNASLDSKLNAGRGMVPFLTFDTRQELTHPITDSARLSTLIKEGIEFVVTAQDYHGNFSKASARLQIDTPIIPGLYVPDTDFESEILNGTHCQLDNDFGSSRDSRFRVRNMSVNLAYGSSTNASQNARCDDIGLCLEASVGAIVDKNNTLVADSAVHRETNPLVLSGSQISFPMDRSLFAWSGTASLLIYNTLHLEFIDDDPARLRAEVSLFCYKENTSDTSLGCPVPDFDHCNVDEFGPFVIEGVLSTP